MRNNKLYGFILISLFVYSCQQPYINNGTVTLPSNSPNSNSSMPTVNPSINPIPTVSPSPSMNPFPCTGITRSGKNFSIKCSYPIDMIGSVRNKDTLKGVKAVIKIERDGKTNIIETSDNGFYEITSLFFNNTYQNYGTYKFTISASGYIDLVKEITYDNGGLTSENPINFDLEVQ